MTARIALVAVSAAFGLLLAASGAAEDKVTRIGLLTRMLPNPSLTQAFHQGLRDLGYVEGKNIVVEWRNAVASDDELPPLAAELVRSEVDVIVTESTPATRAVLRATKTIPVVFAAVGDPLGTALVESLARPGANATGVSILATELNSKRLDLLHQLAPSARRVVLVTNYGNPGATVALGPLQALPRHLASSWGQWTCVIRRESTALFAAPPGSRRRSSGGWWHLLHRTRSEDRSGPARIQAARDLSIPRIP